MSVHLEETSASFDVQTASTLYWKTVPVLLKQQDREETVEDLNVRLLSGVNRHNHNLRILRIHISSEEDSFFLHSLEVSEEDFQSLKVDQGILVDFSNFPNKVITLLTKCIESKDEEIPRFQAELVVSGFDSLFRIVETNDFNKLPHITLRFRPGSDSAIKQFLAFRLSEVKANCCQLSQELKGCEGTRDSVSSELISCKEELSKVQEEHERCLLEMQGNSHTQLARAQEEKAREKAELKDNLDREWGEIERRLRERQEAMNVKNEELDQENRRLRTLKCELETKVSEMSHRLASTEGYRTSLQDECDRLKDTNKHLSEGKHGLEIKINEMKAEARAMDEKVRANEEVIAQQKSRISEMESSNRQLESRCQDLCKVADSHESRVLELTKECQKTGQIIQKLANDLKICKEKSANYKAALIRQEEKISQQKRVLERMDEARRQLENSYEKVRRENADLLSENTELKAKLEEGRNQLQETEGMIRWLNKQINDAQLQSSTHVQGSRYKFRPNPPSEMPHFSPAQSAPAIRNTDPSSGRPSFTNPSLSARLGRVQASSSSPRTKSGATIEPSDPGVGFGAASRGATLALS